MVKHCDSFLSHCKSSNNLSSALIHSGEKLVWSVRILLESLQYVLKMYTYYLSENQGSIQFRCRIVGLFMKQSLFRRHNFDIAVYRIYCDYWNGCFQHLNFFSKCRNVCHALLRENILRNQPDTNFKVVEKLFCFHLMNFFHTH